MKLFYKTTALLLSAALLTGSAALAAAPVPVSAAQTDAAAADIQSLPILPERELYYGTIREVLTDGNGALTGLRMESEARGEYIFHLNAQTLLLDSGAGIPASAADFKAGDRVYVFHSPAVTMSLPPQSYAEAVVRNIPQDAGAAMLHTVEEVRKNADGSLLVVTDRGSLHLTLTADTAYSDFKGRRQMSTEDVRVGVRLFAWYPLVLESYPAQTTAKKAVILPAAEGGELPIVVNGETLASTAKGKNGALMVPAAAVGRALGMQVSYARVDGVETVTLTNGTNSLCLTIGADTCVMDGDMVLTLSAPAVIEAPGTTWLPADALAMLTGASLSTASGAVVYTAK